MLCRHDTSGDRGGPAPAAGFRRGDARRAGAEGPAGSRGTVRARAAGRWAAEVDGANGGRLGIDHQRLQQFITSSTWDYVAVRRNVARWFASSQPVDALVVDDTGFPKDGTRRRA